MAAAAKLLIDIAADIAKLRSDFGEANKILGDFGKGVEKIGNTIKSALGGIGIGLSVEGIRQFVDSVADIGEAADKVQLGTDSFQALTAALRDAGVSAETTSSLLARANQTLGNAFDGNKEAVELMRRLRVGLIDLQGNAATFEQTLPRVARAILDIENPMQRASAAAAFFGGKVGKEAIPALQEMAKGTEALKEQYRSEIVPEETIRRFDELSDSLKSLAKQSTVEIAEFLNNAFTSERIQAIKEIAEAIRDAATATDEWIKKNNLGDPAATYKSTKSEIEAIKPAAEGVLRIFEAIVGSIRDAGIASGQLREQLEFSLDNMRGIQNFVGGGRGIAPGTEPPPGSIPIPGTPDPFKRFPGIKSTGVDKFTEAMTRLKAEIEATQQAIDVFNRSTGLPTKEAERLAKLAGDIGTKQAQMIKGVEGAGQQAQIKERVEALERLKFALDDLKQVQSVADEVSRKYGDGQKELADRTYYLDKAFQAGKISVAEYDAALKEANETADKQALLSKQQVEGIEGIAAGFQFAALSMTQSQTDFQLGQDLFNAGFQTMSQAISEFVDKGTIDFGRLSSAFAKMLIEMAVRWAAMSFLRTAFDAFGIGGGVTATGGAYTTSSLVPSPIGPIIPIPGRANGGPVSAGMSYWVGEYGRERFVPDVSGTIVPNGGMGGNVVINNYAQAKVSANRRNTGSGMNWEILVEPLEAMMAGRLSRGQGALAPAVQDRYGLAEQGRRG